MRKVHNWSHASSKGVCGLFGLRKLVLSTKDRKYQHSLKVCPFPNCCSVTKNPGEHLKSKRHGIAAEDPNYKKMIKMFKKFNPDVMRELSLTKSPCKESGIIKKKAKCNPVTKGIEHKPLSSNYISLSPIDSFGVSEKDNYSPTVDDSHTVVDSPTVVDLPTVDDSHTVVDSPTVVDSHTVVDSPEDESCTKTKKLINEFRQYMTGPNRGRKVTSVQGVVYDIERILKVIGVENDIRLLVEDDDVRLLKFINHCEEKGNLAGSIKKYLASLRDFMQFLAQSKCHNLSIEKILKIDAKLDQWRKKYRKQDRLQSHKRKAEDRKLLINKEQVKLYDQGKPKADALNVFNEFQKNPTKTLIRTDFCKARDFLMVEIELANAHRSGVVVNMKMDEYRGATLVSNQHHIPVWDHKTIECYGAAPVILNSNLFNKLETYVLYMRSQINTNCDELFTSWSGRKLQSSDPSKKIHKMWKESGVFEGKDIPKNLTVNHIRKSVSTAARAEGSLHTKEIAILMAHSMKTANTHYDIYEKEMAQAVGAKEIQTLFRDSESPKKISNSSPALPETPPKRSPRKVWSKEEESYLQKEIEQGTPIQSINIDASHRQVYDKVRRLKCTPPKVNNNLINNFI